MEFTEKSGILEEAINTAVSKGFSVMKNNLNNGDVQLRVSKNNFHLETVVTKDQIDTVEKHHIPGSELIASEIERLVTGVEINMRKAEKNRAAMEEVCGPDGCMIYYPDDIDDEEADDGR